VAPWLGGARKARRRIGPPRAAQNEESQEMARPGRAIGIYEWPDPNEMVASSRLQSHLRRAADWPYQKTALLIGSAVAVSAIPGNCIGSRWQCQIDDLGIGHARPPPPPPPPQRVVQGRRHLG